MKFIHAHQTPKKPIRKPITPSAMCPSTSSWCSPAAAPATATTMQRSKNSSSGVEVRFGSSRSRTTGPTLNEVRSAIGQGPARRDERRRSATSASGAHDAQPSRIAARNGRLPTTPSSIRTAA